MSPIAGVRTGVGAVGLVSEGPQPRAGVPSYRAEDAVGRVCGVLIGVEDDLRDAVAVEVGDLWRHHALVERRKVVVGERDVWPGRLAQVRPHVAHLLDLTAEVAGAGLPNAPAEARDRIEDADLGLERAAGVGEVGDALAELRIADLAPRAVGADLGGTRRGRTRGTGHDALADVADLAAAGVTADAVAGRFVATVQHAAELAIAALVRVAACVATDGGVGARADSRAAVGRARRVVFTGGVLGVGSGPLRRQRHGARTRGVGVTLRATAVASGHEGEERDTNRGADPWSEEHAALDPTETRLSGPADFIDAV